MSTENSANVARFVADGRATSWPQFANSTSSSSIGSCIFEGGYTGSRFISSMGGGIVNLLDVPRN